VRKEGIVTWVYGDQLGSVSAVADGNGNLISEALYIPGARPDISKVQARRTTAIPGR
jgi:hypothetical protein